MKQYQFKRNLVRLYQLIFDSSAIIGLVIGFTLGTFFSSYAVLSAFKELDKSQFDFCVVKESSEPSSPRKP